MSPIRVLVANQPRLMRELVMATISDQTDIEIVGEVLEKSDIASAVETTQPDFLIIALDRSRRLPFYCELILRDHPQIKVLAVSMESSNLLAFYWTSLEVQSNQVEASEEGLLNILRGKVRSAARLQ
jgi:DNA-binding NarL/FixJ family response regulator